MLLYTSKGVTATNQFKVHGQLPLHGMIVSIIMHCLLLSRFLSLAWSHFSHYNSGSGLVCLYKEAFPSRVAEDAFDC